MWTVSAFSKATERLVAEYKVEDADWCLLRALLSIKDEIPTGEYPLSEMQLRRVSGLLKDFAEDTKETCDYFLGYVAE